MSLSHIFQIPPASDWLNLLLLFAGIFVFILMAEGVRKKFGWSQEFSRKLVHIAVGLLMLLTPVLLQTALPLILIAAFFTLFNLLAIRKGWLPGMHSDRHNLGTVYYPLSFLILVLIFWEGYKVIILAAVMVMAIGDAAAAIVGQTVRNPHRYRLIRDEKTREGSLTMFVVSSAAIILTFLLFREGNGTAALSLATIVRFAVLTALIATAAEALGDRGNDNLSVPLLTAVVLYFLLNHSESGHLQFIIGTTMAGGIALLSRRARFLNASGSVATFILGAIIFGFGGWVWSIPVLTFFILSSLLSRVGKAAKMRYHLTFEKGSERDYAQVLANGGIAGLLMILTLFYPAPEFYLCYLAALAAATADTWGTEIGVLWGRRPRLITTFRPVVPGTSGGITAYGSLGAFIGAFLLSLSGSSFLPGEFTHRFIAVLFVVAFSGFLGSLVDSYLGATVQVQYQCPVCHKITERTVHCQGAPTTAIRGVQWMNNDWVNFLTTISGALFGYLGLRLFF